MPSGSRRAPDDRTLRLADDVIARCEAIAACTEEPGRITRPFPSRAMRDAQDLLRGWMRDAGLEVRTDAVGNVIGRRAAAAAHAPILLLGSHLDSVRDAGRYDGVLGVLAALAVATLDGAPFPFHLDVIAFCDEEGLRFGATYFGSRAVTGTFPPELLDVRDAEGMSLREALERAGHRPDAIPSAAYDPAEVLGYLELHIEQGPRLERADAPLGIATAIAGQSKLAVTFEGHANHAGTTPMDARRDALVGAAEWVQEVEERATATPDLVATVGRIAAEPGAVNVVPGRVDATLDVRHEHDAERIAAVADLRAAAAEIARRRGLRVAFAVQEETASTPLDPGLGDRLQRTSGAPRFVSGAGHDAGVMSRFTPSGLLFVRSPGGLSHHPDEDVRREDLAAALEALVRVVRDLARDHA